MTPSEHARTRVPTLGIQIRADHAAKPGGDVALAKAFRSRAQTRGVETQFIANGRDIQNLQPDVVLAFNIDRPLELLDVCRAARAGETRIALYPLHHPSAGVRAYLESGIGGARGLVARISSYDPAQYFHLMTLLRGVMGGNGAALTYALAGRHRLGAELASRIDDLLVSGSSEREELVADLPQLASLRTWPVPHPLARPDVTIPDSDPFAELGGHRRFLIAGRIESRKNPLSVVRTARMYPQDRFIFAGQANETEPNYFSQFQHELTRAPNCRHVGQLGFGQLLQHIAFSHAIISPSWFEVMSLINLYAHALGTPIVASQFTFDGDVIGEGILRYDPTNPHGLAHALVNFVTDREVPPKFDADRLSRFDRILEDSWRGFDEFVQDLAATDFA